MQTLVFDLFKELKKNITFVHAKDIETILKNREYDRVNWFYDQYKSEELLKMTNKGSDIDRFLQRENDVRWTCDDHPGMVVAFLIQEVKERLSALCKKK